MDVKILVMRLIRNWTIGYAYRDTVGDFLCFRQGLQ